MREFRYILVACVLLLGVLAPRPPSADMVSLSPEAQVRAAELDWTHAQHYTVILNEFHFGPSRIVFQHGKPHALRLENTGRFRHTFTAPEFFRTVAFKPGEAASKAETSNGNISLGAGEIEEIEFVPLRAGTYALDCTKPLHGLFGMTGEIVVQ